VVLADLPVHCEHKHIKGDWLFSLSEANLDKNSVKCSTGEQNYQTEDDNFGLGEMNVKTPHSLKVSLLAPNIAKATDDDGTEHHGTWTMIYDEGFEVRVKNMNLFAYSKYKAHDEGHQSFCGETFPGGYHDQQFSDLAQWGCWQGKKTTPVAPQTFRKFGSQPVSLLDLPSPVEHINNHPDATWKARHYEESEKPSRAALGNPIRYFKKFEKPEGFVQESVDVSDIPSHWDWSNVNGESFVDPVINQGNCGSCYSVATSDMISSRSRILARKSGKEDDAFRTSPQSILQQCGFYAQGCEGGFPYLAAKYAHDIGASGWKSVTYTGQDEDMKSCPKKEQLVSRVQDYHYLGGYYGAATPENMMRNIFDHGPLTVGLEVAPTMSFYHSGVFNSDIKLPDHDNFERVNHAVLITGFGEQDGKKYWNIKNSWGKEWGDKGYIKIERGTNLMNVEHMCVAAYPALSSEYPPPQGTSIMHKGIEHSQGHAVAIELSSVGAQVKPVTDDTLVQEDEHQFIEDV
jgi:cathepsin C